MSQDISRKHYSLLSVTRPSLLVPVPFPDPEIYPLEDFAVDIFDGFIIDLLGYWKIPDNTTVTAAREAHETDAEAVLYELAAQFSYAGASTDIQLHFGEGGPEMRTLQQSIVQETDPDGILRAKELTSINNVLVPLRDNRHKDSIIELVSAFDPDSIFVLELYHAVTESDGAEQGKELLGGVRDGLLKLDFTEADLKITVEVVEDPMPAIAAKARKHNVVVVGETEEFHNEYRVSGPVSDYIFEETDTPVIIVR